VPSAGNGRRFSICPRLAIDDAWFGQPVEGTNPGGEVVESGRVSEIAAITAEQDLTQVD
jgi:hypothetical protein